VHHHLPAWVRRAYGQAQPILGDLIGSLEGTARQQFADSVAEVTQLISSGKFSAAWHYPELIAAGQQLYERQAKQKLAAERERRALEASRRKTAELLRDPGVALPAEVVTRLNRELRAAADEAAIKEVSASVRDAVSTARAAAERRREREIDRTRARIERSQPRASRATPRSTRAESDDGEGPGATGNWQEVLLQLKQRMSQESEEEAAASEG
jgi:hypothetical protein